MGQPTATSDIAC